KLRAAPHLFSIAAIFRREHVGAGLAIPETIRPSENRTLIDLQHRFEGPIGIVLRSKLAGPERVELVAAVHHREQMPLMPGKGNRLPHATRISPVFGKRLIRRLLVELPDAAMVLELRTRILSRHLRPPIGTLACV